MKQKANITVRDLLAQLRARRAKIDAAIATIEESLEATSEEGPIPVSAAGYVQSGAGVYHSMTIIDAAMTFLRSMGEPQKTRAIVSALKAGGLKSESQHPYRTIYNTLNQKIDKGVFKAGKGKWGLSEWKRGEQK